MFFSLGGESLQGWRMFSKNEKIVIFKDFLPFFEIKMLN
jgi:hypothetical protein